MLLIQLKKSRKGDAIVLTDPGGDVHACTDAEDLWVTINELLDEDFGEAVVEAPVTQVSTRHRSADDEDEDGDGLDPLEEQVIGAVSQHGATLVTGLLGALQGMSHRGKAPKPRRKKKQEGDTPAQK